MLFNSLYVSIHLFPFRNESLSIYNNEIALKIKTSAVDQNIFLNAQYKTATLLLQFYNLYVCWNSLFFYLILYISFTSQTRSKNRRPKSNPVGETEKLSKEDDLNLQYFIEKMFNPQTGVYLKERKHRLRTIPNCFIGSELVDWILRNIHFKNNRNKAIKFGQKIMMYDGGIFRCVSSKGGELKDDNSCYQLIKYVGNDFFRRNSLNLLEISLSEDIKDNVYEQKNGKKDIEDELLTPDNKNKKRSKRGSPSRDHTYSEELTPKNINKSLKGPFTPTDYMNKPLNRTFRTRSKHMSAPNFISKNLHKSGGHEKLSTIEPQILDFDKTSEQEYNLNSTIDSLLFDEKFVFVEAISLLPFEARDMRKLAKSIVKIFCYQGRDICGMLSHLFKMNFRSGYNLETYFNRNTIEVLIIDMFSSIVCKDWFLRIFESIIHSSQNINEINKSNEIAIFSEIIIDKISGSVHECPYSFRLLCSLFINLKELDANQVTVFLRKFIINKFYTYIKDNLSGNKTKSSNTVNSSIFTAMEYINEISSCVKSYSSCECGICKKKLKSPRCKNLKSSKRKSSLITNVYIHHDSIIKTIDAFVCRLYLIQHLQKEVFNIKKSKKLDGYYQNIMNIIASYSSEVRSYLEDKHETQLEILIKLLKTSQS